MMRFKDFILSQPLFYRLVSSLVDGAKLRAIRRLREDYSGLKVLDLGCGPGNSVRLFWETNYTGIDINQRYVRIAARRYPGRKFIAGDVNRLEWGSGFEIILINSMLHHLDDRQVRKILHKASTALNPGGKIIIQEPLSPGKMEWFSRLMMKLDRGDYFRPLNVWRRLFEQSGWLPEDISFYPLRLFGLQGYKMVSMSLKRQPGEGDRS